MAKYEVNPAKERAVGRPSLAETRRPQILRAFETCVLKYGLEGSSLERIAAEAGVQRSLIRHYFGNRAELTQALIDGVIERTVENYRDVIRDAGAEGGTETLIDYLTGPKFPERRDDALIDARRQHVEQPAATTEQHRDQIDLQLVQHTGLERTLRRVRAVHHHVPVPGGGLRLCHRAGDPIGHVRHQWIVRHRRTRRPVTGHEDRDTVMVAAPVIDLLHGPPTHQYRAGRVPFVPDLSRRPGRPEELPVRSDEPLVQSGEAVAAGVGRFVVRTRDVPVE